jgi:DNA mismatch endonuclease (patch repair protein)
MDRVTTAQRSENMRRIKSKDSNPELFVRRLVHQLGYRYRLHDHVLPGRPDLVFGGRQKIIFVHGCFWHGHHPCKLAHTPASRQHYWAPKLLRNKTRDRAHLRDLKKLGWGVLVIWECEVASAGLPDRIRQFLA